jgi:hypothetical protein
VLSASRRIASHPRNCWALRKPAAAQTPSPGA